MSTVEQLRLVDRYRGPALGLAAAARSGQLGLPHAMHGELFDDDSADALAARALDVSTAVLGPCQGEVYAVAGPDSWTLSLRWLPGVVVTLLVGRGQGSMHRYRLLGSNGQAYADLAGPAFQLVGATTTDVAFGPSPQERAAAAAPGLSDDVARVLAAARRSAASGRAEASTD